MQQNENSARYGYAGKILKVDLSEQSFEVVDSAQYLPEWIGGRALAHRLFWEDVPAGTGAFDRGNELIFALGPAGGTAIPTGGRACMCGIAANNIPEMYASSSMGGWVGTAMKYAGYDAVAIRGKAARPTYLLIDDDQVRFCDASGLWGMLITETQEAIFAAHGRDTFSMAIGPAGEHMVRNACITTSNDHTLSKAGFGAVFGSKNLKALAFHGTGAITPYSINEVKALRYKMCAYDPQPNPVTHQVRLKSVCYDVPAPGGWDFGKLACSPGCNSRCQRLMMNMTDAFTGEQGISQIEKCASPVAFTLQQDHCMPVGTWVVSPRNARSVGAQRSWAKPFDQSDPDYDIVSQMWGGDQVNYWNADFDRGAMLNQLCKEYGIDKWEFSLWFMTWVSACKQEGLLDDIDFGMEPDPEDPAFIRHYLQMITYRTGPLVTLADGTQRPLGDLMAEGMGRAIRLLGKAKYGDSIYHNRRSGITGEQLDIPVSLEASWGQSTHWNGRGFDGAQKWFWVGNTLLHMLNTRDAVASGHTHITTDQYREINEVGPCYSQTLAEAVLRTENTAILTDSVPCCEWQSNEPFYQEQNAEQMHAATGLECTSDELLAKADRARLQFRAILMRNYGRCRDLEVEEVFPYMTYPDPAGDTVTWDEWNDWVDRYYAMVGWDLATGWPYRSTWEAAGLADVADEMEALGMLPPEGGTPGYVRKECPFAEHGRRKTEAA